MNEVVDELREKGAIFVDELSDVKDNSRPVIFSAHGVPKSVPPHQLEKFIDKDEKFDIVENNNLLAIFFLNNFYKLDEAIYKVIFIGLASLTFPHILLEYLLEKNEKRT